MGWPPPSVLAENRENSTPQENAHPDDHNLIAGAINGLAEFVFAHSVLKPAMVLEFLGETAPPNWAAMIGQTIVGAQTAYPDFWAAIPASMKSGSDAVLPDTRRRISLGYDAGNAMVDAIGKLGGNADTPIVTHDHNVNDHQHNLTTGTVNYAHTHTINNHQHNLTTGSVNYDHSHTINNHQHNLTTGSVNYAHTHAIGASTVWTYMVRGSSYTNGGADFRINSGTAIQVGYRTNTDAASSASSALAGNSGSQNAATGTGNANSASSALAGNSGSQNAATGTAAANSESSALAGNSGNQNAALTTGTIVEADEAGSDKNFPPFVTLLKIVYLGAA